MKQKCDKVSD